MQTKTKGKRPLTLAKLQAFIKRRNASDFNTNLQFMFDADACGIDIESLGDAINTGEEGYVWRTPFGILTEYRGKLSLQKE